MSELDIYFKRMNGLAELRKEYDRPKDTNHRFLIGVHSDPPYQVVGMVVDSIKLGNKDILGATGDQVVARLSSTKYEEIVAFFNNYMIKYANNNKG